MIYFIATEDMVYVKIGYTGKLTRDRFNYCSSHCPIDLKLLLFIPGDMDLEKQLHSKFQKYRKKNEWFYLNQTIKDFIVENGKFHLSFKQHRNASPELIESIKSDYLGELTLDQVAKKYQRTKRSIQGILRRNNIRKTVLIRGWHPVLKLSGNRTVT